MQNQNSIQDVKGGEYVQSPMMQPQPVQQPMFQPPMMQVAPQQQVYQGNVNQPLVQNQQPYIIAAPAERGYPSNYTPPEVKTACLNAGVIFVVSSVLSTIFIYIAMCIGWIPWFNYPFDFMVVITQCCTATCVFSSMNTLKILSASGNNSHYVVVMLGFVIHIVVLCGETLNLCISLIPYCFYILDGMLLMVLFVEFVMGIVCILAAMM